MKKRTVFLLIAIALLALMVLAVRERISIQFREDVWGVEGADIIMYSDYKTTQTLKLYGDSGNIDAEGTLDVAGNSTLGAQTSIGTWELLTAQTAISVTMNGYITPTGSYQPLESAGNVGTSNLAAGSAGQILYLVNTADTTITITDTGTLILSGNAALGQYDSLMMLADGTNWIEVAQADN